MIPLKMDAFWFRNTVEPWPNTSFREGDMEESIQVVKIFPFILDQYIFATQQVLPLFKAVSHPSLIKKNKSVGLIFPSQNKSYGLSPDKHKIDNWGVSNEKK